MSWRQRYSAPGVYASTSYFYDDAGNLTSVQYPATPNVSLGYNEDNQLTSLATTGLGTTYFTYTDAGNQAAEYGLWGNDAVSPGYDPGVPRLRTSLSVQEPGGTWVQNYHYDAADRLQTISGPAGTFNYTYRGAGTVWTNLALPVSASITNAYDSAARLLGTALRSSAGTILNQHLYQYDGAGRRQKQTLTDGTYTTYGYDDDGQLSSSLGYSSGGVPIGPEQLGFVYDGGWNMTQRNVNSVPTTYGINDLNEVNGDGYNTFGYDGNGNRTSQSAGGAGITYTYDDENRLSSMATDTTVTPPSSRWMTTFVYDGLGRLRVRQEWTWNSSGGGETEIPKSTMTLSGSSTCYGWDYSLAKDGLTTDPGWVNCSYTSANEFLRVDLGTDFTVSHVAYEPRVMTSTPSDGTWNGVYKDYAIYVTDSSSSNPADWGTPVATGTWTWPNLQERKDVTFTPKTGRYIYFFRISGYGWWTESGYPGFAGANEIWAYEPSGGGGGGFTTLASETHYLYDGKLVVQERDSSNTPLVTYTRGKDLSGSLDGAGGIGGLLARTSGSITGGGGGGESEVSKSLMTLTGSEECYGWNFSLAADNLTTDPGWANCTYTRPIEYLRVDLGGEHNVSHVAYEPRVMGPSPSDGTWNGVYKDYAIYVTDSASDNQSDWGTAVATGTWTWPNLQERKDVTFTPKTGRYVYFARLSAYGWYTDEGYPGYAGANEIWVYEQGGGGGGGTLVHSYYHVDGNGNVTCMVDNNQSVVATYQYDPYGRTINSSGSLAAANVYRFSSKEIHQNSGMYYYLYRFYDPNTQRWPNRDPIAEQGHRVLRGACTTCYSAIRKDVNSYQFCGNGPTIKYDALGLVTEEDCAAQLEKDMADVAKEGGKCAAHAIVGGVIGAVGGIVAGGIGAVFTTPVGGLGIGVVVGGGAEIVDWCFYNHCMDKVNKMKDAAQKSYADCMKKADGN